MKHYHVALTASELWRVLGLLRITETEGAYVNADLTKKLDEAYTAITGQPCRATGWNSYETRNEFHITADR